MTTLAESAHGTLLQIGDGDTPEEFATIAEVLDITGPEETLDTIDVTSHDSADHREEHIPSIQRNGNVSFDVNLTPSAPTHQALRDDLADRVLRNFKIVETTTPAKTVSFAGFVVGYVPRRPVAGVRQATITIKVTGAVQVT